MPALRVDGASARSNALILARQTVLRFGRTSPQRPTQVTVLPPFLRVRQRDYRCAALVGTSFPPPYWLAPRRSHQSGRSEPPPASVVSSFTSPLGNRTLLGPLLLPWLPSASVSIGWGIPIPFDMVYSLPFLFFLSPFSPQQFPVMTCPFSTRTRLTLLPDIPH